MPMAEAGKSIAKQRAYRYSGPEEYHAAIGQIMAYLGYVGGHEESQVEAHVTLVVSIGFYHLACEFFSGDDAWHSEAVLFRPRHWQEDAKQCLLQWYERYTHQEMNPWGMLIGVRPTKLVHHLFDKGWDDQTVEKQLQQHYLVQEGLSRRLVQMARLQRPYVTGMENRIALYVGIPYCASHCLYCSFPSRLANKETADGFADFAAALLLDIANVREICDDYGLVVDTIYMGGGTPTCLPAPILEDVIKTLAAAFPHVSEWTVEAGRPDTATKEKLQVLRHYGVDRVSVNPQTMQQRVLDLMGRLHRVEDIYTMFQNCRDLAFKTINMDFIAGLPGQTLADMQKNMEIVCQLAPENVTIHTLALKKRAPLFNHPLRREILPQSVVSDMVEQCRTMLTDHHYISYYMYRQKYMAGSLPNIGYALPGHIGKYNIQMMEERQTVFAIGPGGANKFMPGPAHKMEKLYMPKDVTMYVHTVQEKLAMRRRLCRIIYGGDD